MNVNHKEFETLMLASPGIHDIRTVPVIEEGTLETLFVNAKVRRGPHVSGVRKAARAGRGRAAG